MASFEPDELAADAFEALLTPLFEAAPGFIGRLAAARPHGSWASLFARADEIALTMPLAERRRLIDAHPRIGAPPGSVSALSFVEQGYDQEAASGSAEAERARIDTELDRLNGAYEARFGFRFVVFVAGRSRAEIVPLLEQTLEADASSEEQRALHDIVVIARARAVKTGLMADDTNAG
jgi:2-oxo-4-hydroxy-4-carboxy--5-ureidoimidazoline (OHCU) decarboxylase